MTSEFSASSDSTQKRDAGIVAGGAGVGAGGAESMSLGCNTFQRENKVSTFYGQGLG